MVKDINQIVMTIIPSQEMDAAKIVQFSQVGPAWVELPQIKILAL